MFFFTYFLAIFDTDTFVVRILSTTILIKEESYNCGFASKYCYSAYSLTYHVIVN